MVGDSINKVLANYPLVDEACHISMSSSDVTDGLLNDTNGTLGACASLDECRDMCNAVTTSVAITIAFVTGVIMVRTLSVRMYVVTYTCVYVHTYITQMEPLGQIRTCTILASTVPLFNVTIFVCSFISVLCTALFH